MDVFGLLMFLAGSALLVMVGFVGIDGIANIPGLIVGMSLQVSGAVFCAAGNIINEVKPKPKPKTKPGPKPGPWK